MKKVNKIFIFLNIILVFVIIIKIFNQKQNVIYELEENNVSVENLKKELIYEIFEGVGKYSKFDNEKRINNSEEMKKDLILDDGLIFKDFSIVYENSSTSIKATILNNSKEEKGGYHANLIVYPDTSEDNYNIRIYINKISPQSQMEFITGINSDITEIYRCEIQKIEE